MTAIGACDLDQVFEQQRGELVGYCRRMLGSNADAEDAVQDTFLRSWKSVDRFEGRASLRSWLYRIATNVCLDTLNRRRRRAETIDTSPAAIERAAHTQIVEDRSGEHRDTAERAVEHDEIRRALGAALRHLPPRARSALILREVLGWHAAEVADLLDTTVVAVNSMIQRARSTLATADIGVETAAMSGTDAALLARCADAFEQYDIDALVGLLHDDAVTNGHAR